MTKSEADNFILTNYYKLTTRAIASKLSMPRGSVITRYAILTGKRKGARYTRYDGSVIHYIWHKRLKPPALPILLTCKLPRCGQQFTKRRHNQLFCNAYCQHRYNNTLYGRRKRAKANGRERPLSL